MKRAHEAIKDVLTEQQIKELQECKKMSGPQGDRHHYRRGPRRCLRELDLTDRQRNQIREIHQTAGQQAAGKAESGEESRDIMKKAHKAVRDILTESQLEELENCVRESALPEDPPCRSRRGGRRLQRESSW
jgi:Spy/CpxP family protein refolding chaperone